MPSHIAQTTVARKTGHDLQLGSSRVNAKLVGAWTFNKHLHNLVNRKDAFALSDPLGGSGAPQSPILALGGPTGDTYLKCAPPKVTTNSPTAAITAPSSSITPGDNVTLFWAGVVIQDMRGGDQNNPAVADFNGGFGILRKTNNGGNVGNKDLFYFDGYGGAYGHVITVSSGISAYNQYVSAGYTLTSGAQVAYWNGASVGTSSNTGSLSYSSFEICLNSNSHNETAMCNYLALYVWNRVLSAGEMTFLHNNPYAPLRSWRRRFLARTVASTDPTLNIYADWQMPQLLPR